MTVQFPAMNGDGEEGGSPVFSEVAQLQRSVAVVERAPVGLYMSKGWLGRHRYNETRMG
jgi:hypothetical protein